MDIRFFRTAALILAAGTVLLVNGMSDTASAVITSAKNSADFNLKNWEGDIAPTAAYGAVTDWSVDGGGNYKVVMTNVNGAIGGNNLADGAIGWTVEWRMKMDPTDLPVVGQKNVLEWQFGDNTTNPGHWSLGSVSDDGNGAYNIKSNHSGSNLEFNGGDITKFITIRIAVEGGAGDVRWYIDGADIGSIPGATAALNRQWLGDIGGLVSDGTFFMDYFRMDTTGAYAPFEITFPEPTSNWTNAAGGDWNTGTNWDSNPTVPNSNTSVAGFGNVIGVSPQTVSTSTAVTVSGIVFGDTDAGTAQASYTIANSGSGSVTLDANISSPSISVLEGSHEFTVDVNLNVAANVNVTAGSSLNFNNVVGLNGNTLTKGGSGTVNINGTVNTGVGGSVVVAGGVLNGTGTVNGDLTNTSGTVAPGLIAGTLTVTGDYVQEAGSSLLMEINGLSAGQFDVLDLTGLTSSLTINGGSLDIVTGFAAAVGNTFDILNFNSATGVFDSITGTPGAGLVWDTTQLFVDGTISVVLAGVPGDFDGNGVVNIVDYGFMKAHWFDTGHALNENGELTGPGGVSDGIVDVYDFTEFRENLFPGGASAFAEALAQASAVPEPSTVILLLAAAPACLLLRFRSRKEEA